MQRKTGDDAWLVLQPDGLALLKAWDAGYKWFNENEGEFGRRGGLAQTSEEIEAFRMGWLDAEEFEYQV